jgi:hypothetical protein
LRVVAGRAFGRLDYSGSVLKNSGSGQAGDDAHRCKVIDRSPPGLLHLSRNKFARAHSCGTFT